MSIQEALATIFTEMMDQAVEEKKLDVETGHPAMLSVTMLFDAPTLDEAVEAAQDTLKTIEAAHPADGPLKLVNSAVGGGVVMPKKDDDKPDEQLPDHLATVLDGALSGVLDGLPSLDDLFSGLRKLVE